MCREQYHRPADIRMCKTTTTICWRGSTTTKTIMIDDPEYGKVEGWWQPHRFYRVEESTLGRELWAIADHHYVQVKYLEDWRAKGAKRPIWKGTKEEAFELARLLNAGGPDVDRITKPQMSLTQVRRIQHDRSRRPRTGGAGPTPQFKKCHCGTWYKGESHCGDQA